MMNDLKPSAYQQRILIAPQEYDIFLGGGRGSGKSFGMLLLVIRHAEQYGTRARILYIRKSYKGLADFENLSRDVFAQLYGNSARYNASQHVWWLPGGSYLELGQLEGPGDYAKYQGRSFSLMMVDESGQYSDPEMLDRLRSNLRGPKGLPVRMVMAANPGDVGHHWLAARYAMKAAWQPFHEPKSKRTWINAPGTFLDNEHIDQEEYRAQLESSCPTDPELLRAWLEGDWAVVRGAYFAGCLDEKRCATDPWPYLPDRVPREVLEQLMPAKRAAFFHEGWEYYLAHDYGSSAPSVTYLVGVSPGSTGPDNRFYPKDSIVLIDELATNAPGQLSMGLNYTIPQQAELIIAFCKKWNVEPSGVADDAIFSAHGHSAGSIADEFKRCAITFKPAKKGSRLWGWERMRLMLADAAKPDRPGLYVSRNCEYFWSTVPYLSRDPRNASDLDTSGPDHGADAARYALLRHKRTLREVNIYD